MAQGDSCGSLGRPTRGPWPFSAVWLLKPLAAPWADMKNKHVMVTQPLPQSSGIQGAAMSSQWRSLEGADNRELLRWLLRHDDMQLRRFSALVSEAAPLPRNPPLQEPGPVVARRRGGLLRWLP